MLRLLRLLRVAKLQQALTLLANRFLSAHAFMVMKVVAGWELREERGGKYGRKRVSQLIEGSLEVKLPTIWTDEKQSREEAERRERLEERRVEEKEYKKKEDADARKGRKVAKHTVFPNDLGLRRVEK